MALAYILNGIIHEGQQWEPPTSVNTGRRQAREHYSIKWCSVSEQLLQAENDEKPLDDVKHNKVASFGYFTQVLCKAIFLVLMDLVHLTQVFQQ